MPSRRSIARRLETVRDFERPTPALEQYLTPPEIAAHVCHLASLQGDLTERVVLDLGAGTGMLALGASLSGAARVLAVEIDRDALSIARENERLVDPPIPIEWIRGDVTNLPVRLGGATVLSNPPFGAQRGNRHLDRRFLEVTSDVAAVSYTIHNEGSQAFVEAFAADHGGEITHAFRAPIPVEHRFEFHSSERKTIDAEIFRIEW